MKNNKYNRRDFLKKFAAVSAVPIFITRCTVAYGPPDNYDTLLSGTVNSGGEPLSGVTIELIGFNLSTQSDTAGKYSIRGLEYGEYNVKASKDGYRTVEKKRMVEYDKNNILDFELEKI